MWAQCQYLSLDIIKTAIEVNFKFPFRISKTTSLLPLIWMF